MQSAGYGAEMPGHVRSFLGLKLEVFVLTQHPVSAMHELHVSPMGLVGQPAPGAKQAKQADGD